MRGVTPCQFGPDLPINDESPSWSPTADKIVFKSNRVAGAPWEIWVINSDGSNPVRITNSQFSNGDPSWSPDGTKIVFSAYRNGGNGISIINADGTNETRLLDSPGSEPRWEP